jgi:hypothetical protein
MESRSRVILKDSRGHDLEASEPESPAPADRVRANTKPQINESLVPAAAYPPQPGSAHPLRN